eukprot:GDKJ01053207.1.p1 GENE.GDKJ01053207.1~~GDKJ01053207.1.p1  ORF type:complete len:509 (+),score=110.22 GDKJ01053207.1:74-1600(+)
MICENDLFADDLFSSFIIEHFIDNNLTLLNTSDVFDFKTMSKNEREEFESRVVGGIAAHLVLKYFKPFNSTIELINIRRVLEKSMLSWGCKSKNVCLITKGLDVFVSTREDATKSILNALIADTSSVIIDDLIFALLRANNNRPDTTCQEVATFFAHRLLKKTFPFDCNAEKDVIRALRDIEYPETHSACKNADGVRVKVFDTDALFNNAEAILSDAEFSRFVSSINQNVLSSKLKETRLSRQILLTDFKRSGEILKNHNVSLMGLTEHFWPDGLLVSGGGDKENKDVLEGGCCPDWIRANLKEVLNAVDIYFGGVCPDQMLNLRLDLGLVKIEIDGWDKEFEGTPAQVGVLSFFDDSDEETEGRNLMELMGEMGIWDDDVVRSWINHWVVLGVLEENNQDCWRISKLKKKTESIMDSHVSQIMEIIPVDGDEVCVKELHSFPESQAPLAVKAVLKAHPHCDIRRLQSFLTNYIIDPQWDWDRSRLQKLLFSMCAEGEIKIDSNGNYY